MTGGFFIARKDLRKGEPLIAERMRREFKRQGFATPRRLETAEWVICVYPKLSATDDKVVIRKDGAFAFAVGTFFYRGRKGGAAIWRLLDDHSDGTLDWDEARGTFCAVIGLRGRLTVVLDRLGVFKVFRTHDWAAISSSFNALFATVKHPTCDHQSVYEYVFQGATYDERTVLEQIKLLDYRDAVLLDGRVSRERLSLSLDACFEETSFDAHLERNREALRDWFRIIVDGFPDKIDTALSGGYDSRLILALLRERSVSPRLHVYGASDDPDVIVATRIAASEKFALIHQDKSRYAKPTPAQFPEIVQRNCAVFDGYPSDGIFDNGADLQTRYDRAKDGAVMLNGGGGEIFRNFFYLRSASFTVRQLLWAFFSQFDPAICTPIFSEESYYEGMAEAVRHALDLRDDLLTRPQIEYLYPCLRCNYWMGRNNSINNRLGYALTPFIDQKIVQNALRIPLAYKSHGRFESALIRTLDPALARYPSSYGHDLASLPSWRRRLKGSLTLLRPCLVRRYSYRAQMRIRKAPRPFYFERRYLEAVIDPSFPLMSEFFTIARVHDDVQLNRICTLEYLLSTYRSGFA